MHSFKFLFQSEVIEEPSSKRDELHDASTSYFDLGEDIKYSSDEEELKVR